VCVPQGSVLELFITYTTPLRTLISFFVFNLTHFRTQLFFSLYSFDLDTNITNLQSAIQHNLFLDDCYLLTLISSESDLCSGLKQWLAELYHSSICKQVLCYLWWTPHFLWSNTGPMQILFLFFNCCCCLLCSLVTWYY